MNTMGAAIFGFVGVAVGAFITGAFERYSDFRKERRARRTARRMLRLELDEAQSFLEASEAIHGWAAEPTRVLSNEQWAEHRDTWGADSSDAAWKAVSEAFLAIAELRRSNRESDAGDPVDSASFTSARTAIRAAYPYLPA